MTPKKIYSWSCNLFIYFYFLKVQTLPPKLSALVPSLPDRIYIKIRVLQVPPYLVIYDVNTSIVSLRHLFSYHFINFITLWVPQWEFFFFCRFRNLILKSIRARGCNLYFSYKKNLRTRSQSIGAVLISTVTLAWLTEMRHIIRLLVAWKVDFVFNKKTEKWIFVFLFLNW